MMHGFPDASTVARALAALPALQDLRVDQLEALPQKGLTHAHWRIAGRGLLVRVRRATGTDSLRYHVACFERAGPSGRAPRLEMVIEPSAALPGGALVIEDIAGRPPHLPTELSLLAESLAAIHALPLPVPADRPPLEDPSEPFAATLAGIERNLFLVTAGVEPAARRQIEEELDWARGFAADAAPALQPAPRTLVVTDAHPGNFLVTPSGLTVFVDLEKGAYGSPAIDVAHATLRPATLWDPDCGTVLGRDDIARFVRAYCTAIGPMLAEMIRPWLLPMRRLTWLRTTTAFARFKAERAAASLAPVAAAHAEAVIADGLAPETIALVRREWLGPDPLMF